MWPQLARCINRIYPQVTQRLFNPQNHVQHPISVISRQFHLFAINPYTRLLNSQLSVNSCNGNELLKPCGTPLVNPIAGFKVKGRLRRRCKDCYFVIRQERLYVICKTHPRHKQMAMKKSEKNSWILTDATQSKERAW